MIYPKPHDHKEEECIWCEVYRDIKLEEVADTKQVEQANAQLQVEADKLKKYG